MKYLRITTLLLLLLPVLAANAQSKKKSSGGSGSGSSSGYSTGIGLRGGGYSSGLTIKHFLGNGVAIEGLLTTEYAAHGGRLTILGEKHHSLADVKGLQFYYGAGFHAGSYQARYYFADDRFYYNGRNGDLYFYKGNKYGYYYDETSYIAVGADLILGLEYKLPDLPFVVGIDYKPFFEVFHGYNGFYNDAAISLRFTF